MRIRTIKPEFWTHESLCACSEFTRLLAIALLNWADDHGYFLAHPNLIKGSLFPFDECSSKIPGSLDELSRVGWIEVGKDTQGRKVGRIKNFAKHQRVDRPQASKIKDSSTFDEGSSNDRRMIDDGSTEEGNGKEGNKEGKGAPLPPEGDGVDAEKVRLLESVIAAYPMNGNINEAKRALLLIPNSDYPDILEKTKVLAERMKSLPPERRSYCPRKHTFFEERRWNDDPNHSPWTHTPPESGNKKRFLS